MKYGFIGGTPRGYALLQVLLKNNFKPEFCIILKEDDHEHNKVSNNMLELANKNTIVGRVKKKLHGEDYELIKTLELDFAIVCGWRSLIKPEIGSFLKFGLIAAHDSLLPQYRGFAPLNWAIINGEVETGVTLFVINNGDVDTGDIVSQEKIPISFDDDINDVYSKVIEATNNSYLKMIRLFLKLKHIPVKPQTNIGATYTCKRTPDDGKINWYDTSTAVYNLIRALIYPFSGAFFFYLERKFEIRSAILGPQNSKKFSGNIPGRIISITREGIEVLCGSGTILIKEVYDSDAQRVTSASQIFKSITIRLT